jgi:predicted transposase YbfD/YdcC
MRDIGIIGNMPGYFEEVETKQPYNGYWYKVKDIITIVVLGSVCGLKNLIMIYNWAKSEKVTEYLQRVMRIPRVPSYGHLTVIVGMIDSESLDRAFTKWVMDIVEIAGKTLSIDGKRVNSTEKMNSYESPLHIVSAYISELGLTLGQEAASSKSNEISAMRELLKKLEIKGAMVVADALNCQKKTVDEILKAEADYLLQVKGNQGNLSKEIKEIFEEAENIIPLIGTEKAALQLDKHGNRNECRTGYVNHDIENLKCALNWHGLKCIGAINRRFEVNGEVSDEWHYYISSKPLSAEELLKHARLEWKVESMHWLLDVHFEEDKSRIFCESAQKNLNILHKCALNLISEYKRLTGSKKAVSAIMRSCLFDVNFLDTLLAVDFSAFMNKLL